MSEYTFHKGMNSIGCDLAMVGRQPIEELKLICDDMLTASGFTSDGYIKYNINKLVPDPAFTDVETGVYVKNCKINNNDDSYGFIITRHVNSEITNKYWQECYRCIRRFYNNHIIIIDDNSKMEFVTDTPKEFFNYTVIKSEFPQRGELLGYYYFHKLKPFKRAVILHDSVFIKKGIDFAAINEPIKLLWLAVHNWDNDTANINLLSKLNNATDLIKFYKDKSKWSVCFGVMSVIDYDFLNDIQIKYNFFTLLQHITNRPARISLERIFGCICCYNHYGSPIDSIFGFINQYVDPLYYDKSIDPEFVLRWKDYEARPTEFSLHIVKIYSGR